MTPTSEPTTGTAAVRRFRDPAYVPQAETLGELRQRIDAVDARIVELLVQREPLFPEFFRHLVGTGDEGKEDAETAAGGIGFHMPAISPESAVETFDPLLMGLDRFLGKHRAVNLHGRQRQLFS